MTKHQLKEYCEAEFENIDAVTSELFSVVKTEKSEYSTPELAAIATFIHNCYNGVENVLKRALSFNQIEMKDTPTWHKDLLKTSLDIGIVTNDLYNTYSHKTPYTLIRRLFHTSKSFRKILAPQLAFHSFRSSQPSHLTSSTPAPHNGLSSRDRAPSFYYSRSSESI